MPCFLHDIVEMRKNAGTPHRIINVEREAYRSALSPPERSWPPDVSVLYEALQNRLFEEGLRVRAVQEQCGLSNHNVSSRFKHYVGIAPKAYVLDHRMRLAKRLLRHQKISVTQVAFAVGYELPNAFSGTFKRWVGCTPTRYQQCQNEEVEDKSDV